MKPWNTLKGFRLPSLVITLQLIVGLSISLGTLWVFAEISEEVLEGEAQRLDTAVLTWVHSSVPGRLETFMRLVTTLGYPWVAVPMLVVAVTIF